MTLNPGGISTSKPPHFSELVLACGRDTSGGESDTVSLDSVTGGGDRSCVCSVDPGGGKEVPATKELPQEVCLLPCPHSLGGPRWVDVVIFIDVRDIWFDASDLIFCKYDKE